MKLILSRKGFDTSAGGCPNPVFPDGSFLALPIPDAQSPIRYSQIQHDGRSLGPLVSQLTGNRAFSRKGAHLDPDLLPEAFERQPGWRPLLGQHGAAQAHLANHGVGEGDLFVFFALFRPAERHRGRWRFVPGARAFHAIWGWLQVAEVWPLSSSVNIPEWAAYHPHLFGQRSTHNSLYVAGEHLAVPGMQTSLPGAGVVAAMAEPHRLTAPDARGVTDWRLPAAFMPGPGKTPLSYHHKPERWRGENADWCRLQCAARGQEFVLDLQQYPGVAQWLATPGLLG
ncbi:Nmad3 family putative nucleotide modification protein [Marinobacter persicus]|uniref:Nucleotide modification associated domain-containing protein n=1 Tax=Marinobacter persicus TaxID=930118 RepID=A0A2S6GAW3_9GAMM|nr:hypothetical protein [Marinobacter persicus]PPK53558.1 hypothetical protein BY455_10169 [Marinobacter persicus]PPK56372.1 hypothetical protein B0H24_100169 [Marinobacter persicus]PPK59945.1 hypothetical protein BY454_10169 [Marinobacter persicus]